MATHCRILIYAALAVVCFELGHPLACAVSIALCATNILWSLV